MASGRQGHFKREAQLNLFGVVAFFGIGLLIAFLGVNCRRQLEIDACLDAGGSYDYEPSLCEFQDGEPAP